MPPRKLSTYRAKRDFRKTRELAEKVAARKGHAYLIQKHAARRLHYDFRLEAGGVLKSWAMTRGPSLDPADKRPAVHVEDHPLEYGSFEGSIPQSQYGGGTVMLWDTGTWEPEGDFESAYKKGHLDFNLYGKRLKGRWHLVRMGKASESKRENWLLIKGKDKYARPGDGDYAIERFQKSVVSQRTMEQIVGAEKTNSVKAGAKINNRRRPIAMKKTDDTIAGVRLSHPDKLLYPADEISKRDIVLYYEKIAPLMLPHVVGRPISLVRCPNGEGKPCFFQRHGSKELSPYVKPVTVEMAHDHEPYIMIEDVRGLIALVQMDVLEIHVWGARGEAPDKPDRIVFDLDPAPDVPFDKVKQAASDLRGHLRKLKLESFLKITGGKGLHVVMPIARGPSWDEMKAFSRGVAEAMEAASPGSFITNSRKDRRAGKIYIDYVRNSLSASAIAPYSTRAKPGAPVALPLAWKMLGHLKSAHDFTMRDALARRDKDPWAGMGKLKQKLLRL